MPLINYQSLFNYLNLFNKTNLVLKHLMPHFLTHKALVHNILMPQSELKLLSLQTDLQTFVKYSGYIRLHCEDKIEILNDSQ